MHPALPLSFSALVLFMLFAATADAATVVGAVSRIQGQSEGAVEGNTRSLAVAAPVHLDEVVTTGRDARLELTLEDGTKLTIGENARLKIDAFVYKPRSIGNRIQIAVAGPFRFVSGALSKTPSSTATAVTPVATIGIRGTIFWGGPIDGDYGVFLTEGAVSVETSGVETILDQPGQGVNITLAPPLRDRPGTGGAVPGEVTIWSQDKVDRALATVTFN